MKIIIVNDGQDQHGPDAMANSLCICDCILKDAKDGDEVTAEVKGTLIEHDGKRYIAVHTVDGAPVEEMDAGYQDMSQPDEPSYDTTAGDALSNFMKNRK